MCPADISPPPMPTVLRKILARYTYRSLLSLSLITPMTVVGQSYRLAEPDGAERLDASSRSATSFTLNEGGQVPSWVAMEVVYWDLGELMHYSGLVNTAGVNLSAKAAWPFFSQWSMYSQLGVFLWQAQDVTDRQFGTMKEGASVIYTGGMAWRVAEAVALNLEYKVFELDGLEGDGFGLGVSYEF